jgi:hypothetical protein
MRKHYGRILGLSLLVWGAAGSLQAQQWEFGGTGGFGFLSTVSAAGTGLPSATTGFEQGMAASAYVGQTISAHLGGELRYDYLQSNLEIEGNGTKATFSGYAHAIHYDVIIHSNRRGARQQIFAAIGGGLKIFEGTGQQEAYQPLSQYGYFTNTRVLKPMVSVGGGVKYALTSKIILRTEVRDYITPFPTSLIAPASGVKFGSILQDIVPMVGISYLF